LPKETAFDYNDAMLEAAIDQAVAKERKRCAKIARFAAKNTTTPVGQGVANAIAEGIENDALS
jgi:hypothetical protein